MSPPSSPASGTPSSPADSHPRSSRRKDARPSELLAAALDLFVERGFAATRAEEVAHRAGVSKGTLFLYFATKEDLFKAVVRENIAGRYPDWRAEVDAFTGTTGELLHYCMQQWWAQFGATKASGISKLIMSEASNFPELAAFYQEEVVQPGHELIARVLQRGIDRGEFRALDMRYAVLGVLAPMLFLVMWKHSIGACVASAVQIVPETFIRAQVDALLNGILAPQPGLPPIPGPGRG